jgi:hypothetical protein
MILQCCPADTLLVRPNCCCINTLEAPDMPSHYSHGYSSTCGSSIHYGESISQSRSSGESISHASGYSGTPGRSIGITTTRSYDPPPSYTGDRVYIAREQLRHAFNDLLDALIATGALAPRSVRKWNRDERRRLLLTLLLSEWA